MSLTHVQTGEAAGKTVLLVGDPEAQWRYVQAEAKRAVAAGDVPLVLDLSKLPVDLRQRAVWHVARNNVWDVILMRGATAEVIADIPLLVGISDHGAVFGIEREADVLTLNARIQESVYAVVDVS